MSAGDRDHGAGRVDARPHDDAGVDRALEPEHRPSHVAHGGKAAHQRVLRLVGGHEIVETDVAERFRRRRARQHRMPVRIDQSRHQRSAVAGNAQGTVRLDGLGRDARDPVAPDEHMGRCRQGCRALPVEDPDILEEDVIRPCGRTRCERDEGPKPPPAWRQPYEAPPRERTGAQGTRPDARHGRCHHQSLRCKGPDTHGKSPALRKGWVVAREKAAAFVAIGAEAHRASHPRFCRTITAVGPVAPGQERIPTSVARDKQTLKAEARPGSVSARIRAVLCAASGSAHLTLKARPRPAAASAAASPHASTAAAFSRESPRCQCSSVRPRFSQASCGSGMLRSAS